MRRSVATLGARRAHHAVRAQFDQLTAREKEVALCVARGQPNRVIAQARARQIDPLQTLLLHGQSRLAQTLGKTIRVLLP